MLWTDATATYPHVSGDRHHADEDTDEIGDRGAVLDFSAMNHETGDGVGYSANPDQSAHATYDGPDDTVFPFGVSEATRCVPRPRNERANRQKSLQRCQQLLGNGVLVLPKEERDETRGADCAQCVPSCATD